VNTWQLSTVNSGVTAPSNSALHTVSSDKVVKPNDNALHQSYVFYIKTTALGGSTHFFGPYTLQMGCTGGGSGSVTFSNAGSFDVDQPKYVGDSTSNVYTMVNPIPNRAWCVVIDNTIVNPDSTGTSWSGTAKFETPGSQPTT
jgi:hypothetical protein